MKRVRIIPDLDGKKPLRLGLLLLSTLVIVTSSALVYDNMIYENSLNIVGTTGTTTASGSTAYGGVGLSPAVVILGFLGLVIGLSLFGFLRELSKHKKNHNDPWAPSAPVSTSPTNEEWEDPAVNDTTQ